MSINKTISVTEPNKCQSFKKFSLSNKTSRVRAIIRRKLREITDTNDAPASSIFAAIWVGSSNREAALELLESEIRNMSEEMDVAITVVPIPDPWFTVE
jgi:hypothetical protein